LDVKEKKWKKLTISAFEIVGVTLNLRVVMMSRALLDLPPTNCQFSFMARPVSLRRFRIRY
jgi:hypothetical protein